MTVYDIVKSKFVYRIRRTVDGNYPEYYDGGKYWWSDLFRDSARWYFTYNGARLALEKYLINENYWEKFHKKPEENVVYTIVDIQDDKE